MENKGKKLRNYFLLMAALVSFTAGAQKNWKPLFDGKTLNGWKPLAGKAGFKAENGEIVGTAVLNSGNTFLVTTAEYGDFILELDIKIEDTSNNSGVQTRSHFDPAGFDGKGKVYGRQVEVDPSSRRWTGGVYDESRRGWIYPLTLNPSAQDAFKWNDYNHFRIECIGDEMRTWVNGKPVAYVVDTIDTKGFIALQVHGISKAEHAGKKVHFRNIRISTDHPEPSPVAKDMYVVNLKPNDLTAYEKENGWRLLFDGKSDNGWRSAKSESFPDKGWKIENGTIAVVSSQGKESANGGDIVTRETFSAFDLSFYFRLTPGANSGVKYFVTLSEQTNGSAIGLEYQVLDDIGHPDAKLGINGNRTLASLYDLKTAVKDEKALPIGQWNWGRIVVHPDNRVEHYLNGIKVLEYVRGSKEFRDLVANSKYKIWPDFGEAKEGHILLQDHGDAVAFKSIKIKDGKR